jgi:hypothetical protein
MGLTTGAAPTGRNRYFENGYEQGFRRRRVVCPPEAFHGRDGPTVEIPCSFTFSTFEVTHSRRIDHGVRHGQNARRPPRRQGESTRAVVLVPSLSLLAQTLREWTANAERAFAYLAVCSDETVLGGGPVVSTTSELPEHGPDDAAP